MLVLCDVQGALLPVAQALSPPKLKPLLQARRQRRQLLLPAQAALHPAHAVTADPEQLRAAVRELQQQVNHLQAENARLRHEISIPHS